MSFGKVYVMNDSSGLVKVGMSKSPEGRLRKLLIGNPRLRIAFSTEMIENPAAIESACHRKLKHLEVANEWFDCDVDLAIRVVNSCVNGVDESLIDDGSSPIGDSDTVINRLVSASQAGVKIKKIAELSGITYFRIASSINPESYRGSTAFNREEVERITVALDYIKSEF